MFFAQTRHIELFGPSGSVERPMGTFGLHSVPGRPDGRIRVKVLKVESSPA